MGFYPVFLELAGRHVLVVGGGLVAERRVHGLLAADATVTVVSPALTPALAALASGGRLRHHRRGFEPGDLDGVDLAFAATGRGAAAETWRRALQVPEVRRVIVERGRQEAKRRLLERLGAPACA